MRVIAGSARRLQLKTIEGQDTRPTTDRIKETLFNMINNDLYNANFLDLFSGSGGIGIEALSRGAAKAYFVENNKRAADCIKDNLVHTKLEDKGSIIARDAVSSIRLLEDKNIIFDYIYMDPPYDKGLEEEVIGMLANSGILDKDTIIIVEVSLKTDFHYIEDLGFEVLKEKRYKTNKHIFIGMKENV